MTHGIPIGMQRPVENAATRAQRRVIARHEATVRDASLTGCGVTRGAFPSTERYSLTGMAIAAQKKSAKIRFICVICVPNLKS